MLPSKAELLAILTAHPLVKLKENVLNVWIVGSYAAGKQTDRSDIDVLLMIPKKKVSTHELEMKYRQKIISHFVKNKIIGIADHVHPCFNSKRIDIYFTYNERKENCIPIN